MVFDCDFDEYGSPYDIISIPYAHDSESIGLMTKYSYVPCGLETSIILTVSTSISECLILTVNVLSITVNLNPNNPTNKDIPTVNGQKCVIPFNLNGVDNFFCVPDLMQNDKTQCNTSSGLSNCILGIDIILKYT